MPSEIYVPGCGPTFAIQSLRKKINGDYQSSMLIREQFFQAKSKDKDRTGCLPPSGVRVH